VRVVCTLAKDQKPSVGHGHDKWVPGQKV